MSEHLAERARQKAAKKRALSSSQAAAGHPPSPATSRPFQRQQSAPTHAAPQPTAAGRPSTWAPSFLPQQAARSSSVMPPNPRSTTGLSTPRMPPPRPGAQELDPFSRTESSHHRPSDLARPARASAEKPTSTTSRYQVQAGTSSTATGAPVNSRPASNPGTVNRIPQTSTAQSTERSQLTSASLDLLRSVRRPTLPPVPSSSGEDSFGEESDYDSSPEQEPSALALLGMGGLGLPGMEARPNAMEEIQRLLQDLPDIDVPPEDRANTPVQMSITLMEHQKVALKWLKDQENNRAKKGGLLAGMRCAPYYCPLRVVFSWQARGDPCRIDRGGKTSCSANQGYSLPASRLDHLREFLLTVAQIPWA